MTRPAAIVDVDGTLVDTNYHHALAWSRSFLRVGVEVPLWRLHRHVGMGGDRYVAAVAGDAVEERHGDELRAEWERLFDEAIGEVRPLPGANELLRGLKERGHTVVLASSSIERHLDHLLDLVGARGVADGWTMADDVEATKPDPELVEVALGKAGTREAVMVGDTTWDCEAARRAGLETVAVLTGGFGEAELRAAGAAAVLADAAALLERLDETPLGRSLATA